MNTPCDYCPSQEIRHKSPSGDHLYDCYYLVASPPNEHNFSSNTISICQFLDEPNHTFFLLHIMFTTFTHAVSCSFVHFYYCTPLCCMNMSQFIEAFYCWMLLYCLLFGMIMTKASMHIPVSIIWNTYIYIFFWLITRSGTPGSYSTWTDNAGWFCRVALSIYAVLGNPCGSICLHSSLHQVLLVLLTFAILLCVKLY